ncbi:Sucrose phosphorylase [Pirellulimonas nuda]|uniref:Sucrose phosphorylase n=1 Tax=Pirellulimonas nuda TaxID=2528009 RepID=A0A518DFE8_9BACT|nr:alpha-amylase family glycosyl hydrolase [Pirellulimonas nuda]QDU90199.1 Sucrose phosphorylase [Pirellulimonas nuda]
MPLDRLLSTLRPRLERIYSGRADEAAAAIGAALAPYASGPVVGDPATTGPVATDPVAAGGAAAPGSRWTERDVVLITYADQLRSAGRSPLRTLGDWLRRERLAEQINTVHLLPFFPSSSDDGFSVVDYLRVDPESGDWGDVEALGDDFGLMFDLVLNHASQHSAWFQSYLRGEAGYERFFFEGDPAADLSQVVRPRSLPLLTPFDTAAGTKHVWTTFSADQVDLNYAEPAVLARMLAALLEYARRGARIIRLDAVAFLWKTPGTNCLHLPQTHEVVKLMRDVLDRLAPGALVLTETNVPHAENVSYFGGVGAEGVGDEAHMVYQFSLPPLLLEAFSAGDASAIRGWLANLAPPPPGCTFFNFTASHDGVGVRPLEGLVSDARLASLVDAMRARGGLVNTRRRPDGSDAPYELNISYVDALAPDDADRAHHLRRFLAAQAVMLALPGMPAVYFHNLVGTQNDYAGARATGQNRRINRRKFGWEELDGALAEGSLQRAIYDGMRDLLSRRVECPALHPDAAIELLETGSDAVLAFRRTAAGGETLLCAVNFSAEAVEINFGKKHTLLPGEHLWQSGPEARAKQSSR